MYLSAGLAHRHSTPYLTAAISFLTNKARALHSPTLTIERLPQTMSGFLDALAMGDGLSVPSSKHHKRSSSRSRRKHRSRSRSSSRTRGGGGGGIASFFGVDSSYNKHNASRGSFFGLGEDSNYRKHNSSRGSFFNLGNMSRGSFFGSSKSFSSVSSLSLSLSFSRSSRSPLRAEASNDKRLTIFCRRPAVLLQALATSRLHGPSLQASEASLSRPNALRQAPSLESLLSRNHATRHNRCSRRPPCAIWLAHPCWPGAHDGHGLASCHWRRLRPC